MDLTDITGTGKLVLTGDLQIDSLNYLCLTEEAQAATTNQIACDLVQLHQLDETERHLTAQRPRKADSQSPEEELKRQLLSVQQIAKDLIELQAMLASMGNFYTLSFLEKYYKNFKGERPKETTTSTTKSDSSDSELTKVSSLDDILAQPHSQPLSSPTPALFHGTVDYLSDMEQQILRSIEPIAINEESLIEVNGESGIWANKHESEFWQGSVALEDYKINEDNDPEIVYKKSGEVLEYVQELAIRYMRPYSPEPPGDIIITQEADQQAPPAPPIIIRQQAERTDTPSPLVIREMPPTPPPFVARKVIKISGKQLPPPPRRVIIERLPALPVKPQPIVIERWLPYPEMKRRVVYNRTDTSHASSQPTKNLIIQWEEPHVLITKQIKYLGAFRTQPDEYKRMWGSTLTRSSDLPEIVNEFETPEGLELAAERTATATCELVGDVFALKLVDLNKEGLEVYADLVSGLVTPGRRVSLDESADAEVLSFNLNDPKEDESLEQALA